MIPPNVPLRVQNLPVFKQAIEVMRLSTQISQNFVDDLNQECVSFEDPEYYYSGDIIQQCKHLVPEIIKAESESLHERKYKHAATVKRLTKLLYKNCERLKRSRTTSRDFLPILQTELQKFHKLQRHWMLTL